MIEDAAQLSVRPTQSLDPVLRGRIEQNILLEQYLQSLPTDLAVKVRERKPARAKEPADCAYDYDQAHTGEGVMGSLVKQPVLRDEASLVHKSCPK